MNANPWEQWQSELELDRILSAVAHPARRYALDLLVYGSEGAGSLAGSVAATWGMSASRASEHLTTLARARVDSHPARALTSVG